MENKWYSIYILIISIMMAVLGISTLWVGLLTPPVSGPYCLQNCIEYPYFSIANRWPGDYLWMVLAIPFIIMVFLFVSGIHHNIPKEKKFISSASSGITIIASGILLADYFIQLSVIQPSTTLKQFDGIALITQYNPHGIFIALEEAGYSLISFALALLAISLNSKLKFNKVLKWTMLSGFIVTTGFCIVYVILFEYKREYRLEVAVISIVYLTLILSGIWGSLRQAFLLITSKRFNDFKNPKQGFNYSIK